MSTQSQFLKFTRLDGTSIWINASFIVTVEPRRQGGSVVVPIGDGLDYDVRESPERVLEMLNGTPRATIVPVPPPKSLTVTPEDVSPEPEHPEPTPAARPMPAAEKATSVEDAPAVSAEDAPAAAKKTTRRKATTTRKTRTKAAKAEATEPTPQPTEDASQPTPEAPPAAPEVTPPPTPPPAEGLTLTDDFIARITRMAPGSTKKLYNTLVAQFKDANPEATTRALVARGILMQSRDRILWMTTPAPQA